MLVIEKGEVTNIHHEKTGSASLAESFEITRIPRPLLKPANAIFYAVNYILRLLKLPGVIWK